MFNEVMHHPNATNKAQLDWIEPHNQMAVDMAPSGWSLSASGTTLQSVSVVTGAYANTGLRVTVEVDGNASHAAVAPRNKFYGLVRWDEAGVIHCWHCPVSV